MRSISTCFRGTLARVGNGISFKGILSEVARQFEYLHFLKQDKAETLAILVFYYPVKKKSISEKVVKVLFHW